MTNTRKSTKTTAAPRIHIIGAGIVGLTCAQILTQRFEQDAVHIFDSKPYPADNASYMAGGMIAPISELDHMPHSYLEAGELGLNHWKKTSESAESNFEFSSNGSLLIAHSSDLHILDRFSANLPANDKWCKIDRISIENEEPALSGRGFSKGIITKDEGHLHPKKLMAYLCNSIQNKHIETTAPDAEISKADWVLDCRGMGANDPDLRGVKGEIALVHNPYFSLRRPLRLMHPRYPLYIVPRADNIFMIGATIIESSGQNGVALRSGMELMSALFSLHPSFADSQIIALQAGIRPAYPDNLPRIKVNRNVISINGLFRHGYLLSPALAVCAQSIITGEACAFAPLFVNSKDHEHSFERTALNH